MPSRLHAVTGPAARNAGFPGLLSVLLVLLAAPGSGVSADPVAKAPGAAAKPAPPRIHPVTGARLYALQPGLEVDPSAGELYVAAKVCLDTGILEFLLVRGETKAYESALSTEAQPSQVMAGMLLLKWKPGDLLSIVALRGQDTLALDAFLRARNRKASGGFSWRLTGSNHAGMESAKGGFWADREGIHVALVDRPEAVVQLEGDRKNPYHNAGFGYAMGPGAGGKGAPLTLIFRKLKS